jgi:hypothetical protein
MRCCARALLASATLCAAAACATARPPAVVRLQSGATFALAGHFALPPLSRYPPVLGVAVGGLSGLAPTGQPGEFIAISDDRVGSRAFRIRLAGEGAAFTAQVFDTITLQGGGTVPELDAEGIAVLSRGRMYVSSEGIGHREPRVPPAIVQYTVSGAFVRTLVVRDRYVPNATGPLTHGVRPNFGFEALTVAPGQQRLFTASETALVQDGEPVTFDSGTMARLLEYRADGDLFEPAREFIYPIAPMDKVDFQASLSVVGLVELLALTETELLALERTYIEEAGGTGRGINRARIFHVSIDGASDVSQVESLKGATGLTPLRKTPVLDLSSLDSLPRELVNLDNFEGLAFGPTLDDGTPTLVMMSDDNFNERQRSWFLLLEVGGAGMKSTAPVSGISSARGRGERPFDRLRVALSSAEGRAQRVEPPRVGVARLRCLREYCEQLRRALAVARR